MKINQNFFMQLAINEAWKYQGLTYPNPSVGCVVIKDNNILAVSAHKKSGDPHAEVLALKKAYIKLTKDKKISKLTLSKDIHTYLSKHSKNVFENASIFTSLSPCTHIGKTPSCANLIVKLKIKKVFISQMDPYSQGSLKYFKRHNVLVKKDLLSKKSKELISPFLKWKKNRFVFFKFATSLNGTAKQGYISSKQSLKKVHKLRSKIDLIVIGGNTIRRDRPTLDTRFANGKAPDIFIYSKSKDFDNTIPLFGIKNRKVIISDDKSILDKYNFIMIEGMESMMNSFKHFIDYYLIFIAPKTKDFSNFKINKKFKFLHINKTKKDLEVWAK